MQFILAYLLAGAPLAQAYYATETDYVTQYVYEQINVLADANGVPYSTQTVSGTSYVAAGPTSHSHSDAQNYNYITATETEGAPAPSSSSSSSSTSSTSTTSTSTSTSSTSTSSSSTTSTSTTSTTPVEVTTSDSKPWTTSTTSTPAAAAATTSSSSSSFGSSEFKGDATYYDVGLGACGFTNSDSELVAALNWEQWDQFGSMSNGNPACNKKATLQYGGKSVTVTIVDKCMGCKYGDLDLSPAAFQSLADESVGRFQMSWSFV